MYTKHDVAMICSVNPLFDTTTITQQPTIMHGRIESQNTTKNWLYLYIKSIHKFPNTSYFNITHEAALIQEKTQRVSFHKYYAHSMISVVTYRPYIAVMGHFPSAVNNKHLKT
jgi:hypothetical protein